MWFILAPRFETSSVAMTNKRTQTDQTTTPLRQFFQLTMKHTLKLMSYLIIPLMLGIFTGVMTSYQQRQDRQLREEDRVVVSDQRHYAENLAAKQYQQETFNSFLTEMREFLEESDGVLTTHPAIASLARVKTLDMLNQLDPRRNSQIIRFLYEAGQLNELHSQRALDLTHAKLRDIDFSYILLNGVYFGGISFVGVHIFNATFVGLDLRHAKFSKTRLKNIDFSFAKLDYADFSFAELENVNFTSSTLLHATFLSVNLHRVTFSCSMLGNTHSVMKQTRPIFILNT